jgi:hypothetical protein
MVAQVSAVLRVAGIDFQSPPLVRERLPERFANCLSVKAWI